eukprot:TRINITY_DN4323_c0_g2_i1.p1 TRINITY_DN4323_c0_g2~~TRINITY_DN4323_c0_g2_i1.p1  ORF type:complete len:288 (+),score=33.94 TRINITY_DN4323_c0_g2_i1:37-864(+)
MAENFAGYTNNIGGFNFDLCRRNTLMEKKGMGSPPFTKTGTTIVGCVFRDGVALACDTRSTSGSTVADKNCEKIHFISDNIYCCGAGTAADTEAVTSMVSSALELHRFETGRQTRVITAQKRLVDHLFRYQGHIGAALILGGVDLNGPHLFTIFPHGSADSLPFATMGSGSVAAMAILEQEYKEDMEKDEAIALVSKAIKAGIFNDLGSGSNVDVCIIDKSGSQMMRNLEFLMAKPFKAQFPIQYQKGTAPVVNEKIFPTLKDVEILEGVAMDTS